MLSASSTTSYVDVPEQLEIRMRTAEQDVAFVHLQNEDHKLYNLLLLSTSATNCRLGEDVYKIGSATGLTIGKLGSLSANFKCPTSRDMYRNVVQVLWDVGKFADYGDCGSLYSVIRGGSFCPIAIHRVSGLDCSYGSNFSEAMSLLSEEESCSFVNPPFSEA